MKVLITGIDGFIGCEISRRLRSSGWDVVGFSNGPEAGKSLCFHKGSVANLGTLRAVFGLERPDACIHLAGLAHADISLDELDLVRQVNVGGVINTARAAMEVGVEQFVFFSSAKVYGDKTPVTGFDEDDDPKPAGIYAEAKYQAEQALAEMTRRGELGVVVIRPVAVFGRGDSRGNYARLIRAVRKGVFPIIGGGRARRSIVYLNRVAERIDRIIGPAFIPGKTYVFSDGAFELREIVESIRRAAGNVFSPSVPAWFANTGADFVDWVWQNATGKEGNAKKMIARLTDSFVVNAHHYDSDFGPLEPLDLDVSIAETCALTLRKQ